MGEDPGVALKELRDALRAPVPDLETFTFLLSPTVQSLGIHPKSVPTETSSSHCLKAISRYLPAIQTALLSSAIPTFLPLLDPAQTQTLRTLFSPSPGTTSSDIAVRRQIALVSYSNLPPLLSTTKPQDTSLPIQSREFVLSVIDHISRTHSVDQLYWAVWSASPSSSSENKIDGARTLRWEDAVKAAVSIPSKLANAVGKWKAEGWTGDVPSALIPRPYFDRFVIRFENLLYELSHSNLGDTTNAEIVLQRLGSLGLLAAGPSAPSDPTPSFLTAILPALLAHLHPAENSPLPPYPNSYLPSLVLSISPSTLFGFVNSILRHLSSRLIDSQTPLRSVRPDQRIKRGASIMRDLIGSATSEEAYDAVTRAVLGSSDTPHVEVRARIAVDWVSRGGEQICKSFTDATMEVWCDSKHVKFSLYAQQLNLTHTLILALSLLRPFDPWLIQLSHRSRFMTAMQSYLGRPDPKIRRLGMLVGEIISQLTIQEDLGGSQKTQQQEMEELTAALEVDEATGEPRKPAKTPVSSKRLNFGEEMWAGEGGGKEECRHLRSYLGVKDSQATLTADPLGEQWLLGWKQAEAEEEDSKADLVRETSSRPIKRAPSQPQRSRKPLKAKPKIVMLGEDQMADPLEGYASNSPSSSRSPSPTPSYLEEIAGDPTLALDSVQKKKITRPVYIQQLFALLKEREKPDELEMGLKWGESLVRAKRSFGKELEEYAVNVATVTIALNDSFHLDDFEEKRQGILTALVASSPRNVAPYLCEQYFSGAYSLQQRSVMLTALAMAARELVGFSTIQAPVTKRIDFPSKVLPSTLHRRYIGPNDARTASESDQIEAASGEARDLLLSKGAKRGEETVPEIAREKRLRVGSLRRPMVAEVASLSASQMGIHQALPPPVVPFREVAAEFFVMPLINRFWQHFQDASTRETRAIATGNSYRGAGTGLLLSPMAIEKLFMTLSLLVHAGRHSPLFLAVLCPESLELAITIGSQHPPQPDPMNTSLDGAKHEAQVVGAALELALVCLDGAVDLDTGRTLAMEKSSLVLAAGEWAQGVFETETRGGEVAAGQGGMREGRIRTTAAGVVVKVSEIAEKYSRLGLR